MTSKNYYETENFSTKSSLVGLQHDSILEDEFSRSRPGFNWDDYTALRPGEGIPTSHKSIMLEASRVYERHGLIKNIIDLMSDLTIDGITIEHPRPNIQRFLQNWFHQVNGVERSERFANNLYKYGNVIIDRYDAPATISIKKYLKNSLADLRPRKFKRRLPSKYVFHNPVVIDCVGGHLANFVDGEKRLGIRFPRAFKEILQKKKHSEAEKDLIARIPNHIKEAMINSDEFNVVPFSKDHDILVYHYKKDDWDIWAKPIIYSILKSIRILEKAQLADLTALDGAVDHLRFVKLGDVEKGIIPTPEAFDKMIRMLGVNNGAGIRTIVWGEDVDIIQSEVDIHQFLGDDKYMPVLREIYAGMGIPPTLTGADKGSGTTNNLVSLKTLVKRLNYGRNLLTEFWLRELEIVRKVMKFAQPASLDFEVPNFGDEEAEKRLWVELADRDIVSHEWIQKRFGANNNVEKSRLVRELKKKVPKRSPFSSHEDSNTENKLPEDIEAPTGRPPGTKDEEPRKKRRFVPVVKAQEIWAVDAQKTIDEILNPLILTHFNKKNMRSLDKDEVEQTELIKASTFFNLDGECTNESVMIALDQPLSSLIEELNKEIKEISKELRRKLTMDEIRHIKAELYVNGVN